MYTLSEKAIIFIDGFINLEYKHKRAIIDIYPNIEDIFTKPEIALNYIKASLGENASNAIKLALCDTFINDLLLKYQKRNQQNLN